MIRRSPSAVAWLKICGLRHPDDAEFCVKAGVDCLGLLIGKSRRPETELDILSWEDARGLATLARKKSTATALLCHSQELDDLRNAIEFIRPQMLQLQFHYDPKKIDFLKNSFPSMELVQTVRVAKPVGEGLVFDTVRKVASDERVSAILLDSPRGGSGKSIDWETAKRLVALHNDKKFILAGGLNPENAKSAIEEVRPFGIDVMTGARFHRGKLDHDRVSQLAEATAKTNV
ncbi:MAG: hypothetical protein GVY36_16250 [Verrucomicrobia bacterium]|jgi:phosphoribosylanthranilate isomerase|nr:hypothetical protein [Verrucomicrobiota bacterium]